MCKWIGIIMLNETNSSVALFCYRKLVELLLLLSSPAVLSAASAFSKSASELKTCTVVMMTSLFSVMGTNHAHSDSQQTRRSFGIAVISNQVFTVACWVCALSCRVTCMHFVAVQSDIRAPSIRCDNEATVFCNRWCLEESLHLSWMDISWLIRAAHVHGDLVTQKLTHIHTRVFMHTCRDVNDAPQSLDRRQVLWSR